MNQQVFICHRDIHITSKIYNIRIRCSDEIIRKNYYRKEGWDTYSQLVAYNPRLEQHLSVAQNVSNRPPRDI